MMYQLSDSYWGKHVAWLSVYFYLQILPASSQLPA
jgi:hypothetical protein